ncbi:MAG: TIGR03936 family radical SAM-associated protein [Pseudothermotoga sp.]
MHAIIKYKKYGLMRFLSAIETSNAIERNIRRSGLPFALTEGFHKKPKISYLDPTPTGVVNLALYTRVDFSGRVEGVLSKLKETSLKGISPEKLWWTELNPNKLVTAYAFKILIPKKCADLSAYDSARQIVITEKSKSGPISYFFENVQFNSQGEFLVIRYEQKRDRLIRARYLYQPILREEECSVLVTCTEALCDGRKLSEILEESSWAIES